LIETEDISKKLPRPYFPSALDCRRVYATLAMDKCSRPGERRFSYTTVTVDEDVLALGIEGSVYLPQLWARGTEIHALYRLTTPPANLRPPLGIYFGQFVNLVKDYLATSGGSRGTAGTG
jgi:hypothetical protein